MSVNLIHSQPSADLQTRVTRMEMDAIKLTHLTRAEVRAVYDKIEAIRDALSRILDRADNKNA